MVTLPDRVNGVPLVGLAGLAHPPRSPSSPFPVQALQSTRELVVEDGGKGILYNAESVCFPSMGLTLGRILDIPYASTFLGEITFSTILQASLIDVYPGVLLPPVPRVLGYRDPGPRATAQTFLSSPSIGNRVKA